MQEEQMNILAIQGSPRRHGNTRAVLDVVVEAAEGAGANVDVIRLAEFKNISGCLECFGCQKEKSEPACAVDDDIQAVLKKATKSDLILWATPVFCWSPSWLAKIAMDRFYCMFKFHEDGHVDSLLEGRKQAAVITAGGDENDGADLVQESFRRLTEYSKCQWLGAFVAASVTDPKTIRGDQSLNERAREFGRKLATGT